MLPFALIDRWRAPAPQPARVAWIGGRLYAHRGLHSTGAPENSLAAIAAAVAAGYGVEFDVQRSSDGQPVVFHDWELDRLTGETGPVARRSADQLGRMALAGTDQHIPTLRQVLDCVGGKVPLLVEIKSRADTRVAALCLAARRALEGYAGDFAIISFDPRVSHWFARHSPLTARGLSFTEEGNRTLSAQVRRHAALWHARPDFITYDLRDLPNAFAAGQRARGLPLVTWTIRTAEQREQALALSDAVIAEAQGLP